MSAPATDRNGRGTDGATGVHSPTRAGIAERTLRTDRWWLQPLLTTLGLAMFVLYAGIRAFLNTSYWVADYHYLTPFYSPCVSAQCEQIGAAHFGAWFGDLPWFIPQGFLALPFLLGFRLTCYYYRKAYYRSVWFSPPACAVAEPHKKYTGETKIPLIVQNVHRYFFYVAFLISILNTYDAILAFQSPTGFGFGLGNVILSVNVILLWGYTLSCHSCRHVAGGRLKHFSKHPVRYKAWTLISRLNTRHMQLAWTTIATLIITDLYVMLVSSGAIADLRFIG